MTMRALGHWAAALALCLTLALGAVGATHGGLHPSGEIGWDCGADCG